MRYIGKRLIFLLPIVLIMSMLVFGLSEFSSGDAARVMAEQIYGHPTRTEIEKVRHENGMDQPIWRRYIRWLGNAVDGDFGVSYQSGQSALKEVLKCFPVTLKLAAAAFLILVILGIPLGILSAVWENSVLDKILQIFSFFSVSVPAFWIGLLLLYLLGVKLHVVSVLGAGQEGFLLPALTLDIGYFGVLIRLMRSSLSKELKKEYIRTCRARGLSPVRIIMKHGVKNAVLPVITQLSSMCISLICGSAIVESIYSIQGVGQLALEAVYTQDLPVLQCFILLITCFVVILNLAVDILYSSLDARIQLN